MRTALLLAGIAAAGIVAATATPALAATTSATPSAGTVHGLRTHHAITSGTQQSENWSGYIKTGSGYTSSSASWTVPTLKTTYDGYSSTWVGIDGASSGDQYLIQTGTEADVVNGRASYDAWWEVITPTNEAPETLYSSLTVHAGDSITASVTKGSSGKWTMTLKDNTSGGSGTHTSSFAGPGQSAEWIQEDTDVNGYISSAPDWQSVHFSGITVNGANPNLTSSQSVDIVDSNGTKEDNTGSPSGGNAFTVTWLAPGTETYVG